MSNRAVRAPLEGNILPLVGEERMSQEFERFKAQVSEDFELTWRMMKQTEERLDARIDSVQAGLRLVMEGLDGLRADLKDGQRQLFGRMRLQEERFNAFFSAMDRRVDKLERSA